MEIKIRGNGFVIKNKHGKEAIKASDLDRRLSKPRLEKTLGVFQAAHPAAAKKLPEQSRYQRRPLQQGSLSEKLFAEYQAEAAARKELLTSLKEHQGATLAAIREKWRLERVRLEKLNILKHNRRNLLHLARRKEAAELVIPPKISSNFE